MSRRSFLTRTGGAAAGSLFASALATSVATGRRRIESLEITPLVYPMKGYFKFFHGGANQGGRAAVLVKLIADDGTSGWGQAVPIPRWSDETLETCAVALRDYFAPAVKGLDPADLEAVEAAMDAAIAPAFSTGMPIARAGLESALWDLLGRAENKPLHELWGVPAPKPILLSWTVNAPDLEQVEPVMAAGKALGYKHFNIKVGPNADFDVQLARKVRQLAPDTFLWADANGGYAPADALAAAPRLADAGVDVLEAPIRPNEISTYQKLTKQNALPILMDEGVISMTDLREFTALGMMHGMAAKPARVGGLATCRAQLDFLKENGMMWLGSGLTDPDLSLAGLLAVYAAAGIEKPAALNGPQFLDATILGSPIHCENGYLHPPVGPGLGVTPDPEKIKALTVKI